MSYLRFLFCCLLLGCCLVQAPRASAQTANVEAVLRYWEITDALRQDQPLTDAVWQEFLALPGNRRYVRSVFAEADLKRYRQAIETAYMPRHDSLLQVKLKAKAWYYVLANDYKLREAEYKRYVAEVAVKPAYLDLMYTRAYEYLPRRAHTKVQDLKLFYTALGNDAISEPEGLVFSLKSAIDANAPKEGILEGHEIHHQLRPGLAIRSVPEPDQALIWAMSVVLNEGSADLIDKKVQLTTKADSAMIHNWLLARAPATLQKLDSVMQAAAKTGAAALPNQKYYRRLFNSTTGHMPGFYMARTIENNGYGRRLLSAIDNPFAFFALYQKAARKDKTRPVTFSETSIAYIKSLEKKYLATMRADTKAYLAENQPAGQ